MAQVAINGTTLEFEEAGTGEPLVFVHGSASDYRSWQLDQEALSSRFRAIRFSRRYHWPNTPISDGAIYSMDEQLDDLQALVRALDAAPAHLVGHSYGALLCLLLAIREPSLVSSLVLGEAPVLSLFVSSKPEPLELLRLLVNRPRTAAAIIRFGATGVAPATRAFARGDADRGMRIFGDAVLGPRGYDRMSQLRRAQVRDNLTCAGAELLGPGFLPLDADQVRKLRVPVLLVCGEQSITLFHRLTDCLEALLPQAERIEIPGASHALHEDNGPAFNVAVDSFVGKHLRRGPPLSG